MLDDGDEIDVMVDALRSDIARDMPLLSEIDELLQARRAIRRNYGAIMAQFCAIVAQFSAQFSDALRFAPQALFTRFVDLPWEYRKLTAEEQTTTADGKWWKKVPKMTKGSVPTKWARELACAAFCGRELAQCRVVNDGRSGGWRWTTTWRRCRRTRATCRGRGDGRDVEGAEEGQARPVPPRGGRRRSDKIALMEAMNNLEKMALIWEEDGGEGKKGGGKKDMGTINARKVVSAIKSAYPGWGRPPSSRRRCSRTATSARRCSRRTRVLESRLSVLKDMALEVLAADKADAPAPPPSEIEKWLESVREASSSSLAEAGVGAPRRRGDGGRRRRAPRREEAGDEVAEAMAVVPRCSTAARRRRRTSSGSTARRERGARRRLVAAGHKTRCAGAPSGAMVSFEAACAKFPRRRRSSRR